MGFLDFLFRRNTASSQEVRKELPPAQEQANVGDSSNLKQRLANEFNSNSATQNNQSDKMPSIKEADEDYIFTKDSQTQVFSAKNSNTGSIEYRLTRTAKSGKIVELGKILDKSDMQSLKKIAKDLDYALDNPRNNGGFNSHALESLKKQSKLKIDELGKKHNIEYTSDIDKVLDNITLISQIALQPEVILNYKSIEKQLPKSIDISQLSFDALVQLGASLTSRIQTLHSIKTPEDAYAHKTSLESFMRSKEPVSEQAKLIALLPKEEDLSENNPEQGNNLKKVDTILDCAKALELIQNEDGLLYSSYLKLEENRIITQIQKDISTYARSITADYLEQMKLLNEKGLSLDEIDPDAKDLLAKQNETCKKAIEMVEMLESSKTKPKKEKEGSSSQIQQDNLLSSISKYMIDTILDVSVDTYINSGLKKDLSLKSFLAFNPSISNSSTAIDYLHAKMSSYGQVSDIPIDNSLRSFIETTDYKSPENSASKDFLFIIAQIERVYIEKQYQPILEEYRKILDKQATTVRPQTPKYTLRDFDGK